MLLMLVKNLIKPGLLLVLGLYFWHFHTPPSGISTDAWHLLIIFISTIIAIMVNILPIGPATIVSLVTAVGTNTLSFNKAFSGYSDPVVWLVLGAFFLSHGFTKSGLGRRISYKLLTFFGKSVLGISYALAVGEMILATVIPSATARTGGIMYPVATSITDAISGPGSDGKFDKTKAFLIMSLFQMSVVSSAMFLTGMAGNALIVKFAGSIGITVTWSSWATMSVLPAIFSIVFIPIFLNLYFRPHAVEPSVISKITREKYDEIGKMTSAEKIMSVIFMLVLALWICGPIIKVSSTTSVLIAISIMIITGIVNWNDLIKIDAAWNTFIWFGALLALADGLGSLGLTSWFSTYISQKMYGLDPGLALLILLLVYFFAHYFFASSTAHVGAMFLPFMLIAINLGFQPLFTVMAFAFASNLCASLTHYGSGPAPILFGSGCISLSAWWQIGFLVSIFNFLIWSLIGITWWRVIGIM